MTVARKTLDAIEFAMRQDGGARFRALQRETLPKCEDAYRADDGVRGHLGASLMGRQCSRQLWYVFRWAALGQGAVDPHMLRLWNRGHLEEGRMVALLMMLGVQVWQHDEQGNQFRVLDHWGHFGGSMDSILLGVPDMPTMPMLGEYKTHNDKSYEGLIANGLLESKFEHYTQMQIYMRKRGLEWGLYMAVNKNNDHIHAELVQLHPEIADKYIARAGAIIVATEPPARISNLPSWWQCKFCDFRAICHQRATPSRNCRTCAHSRLAADAGWTCAAAGGQAIPREVQLTGCGNYQLNPVLK